MKVQSLNEQSHMVPDDVMKAAVYRRYGSAEVLKVDELPSPKPDPIEVLVRVRAASVNPIDWKIRRGDLKFLTRRQFPRVPGADLSGEVVECGSAAVGFEVGDEVFAMVSPLEGGCFAEYRTVPVNLLVRKPDGLSHSQAAAVPLAALTAQRALALKPDLGPASTVLINGASGGVGTFAVQLAHRIGSMVVAVSSERNRDLVRELGAGEVIDYTREPVLSRVDRYDLILDAVGSLRYRVARPCLAPGGVFVTLLQEPRKYLERIAAVFSRARRMRIIIVEPSREGLEQLGAQLERGEIRPVVDTVYPLEQSAAAHQHSESGRARGKIVVEL